jgi:hypothetical protein
MIRSFSTTNSLLHREITRYGVDMWKSYTSSTVEKSGCEIDARAKKKAGMQDGVDAG